MGFDFAALNREYDFTYLILMAGIIVVVGLALLCSSVKVPSV